MSQNNSSISLSKPFRKELKVMATHRDFSYEELIKEMKKVYSSEVKFDSEKEFCEWFLENPKVFGYEKVLRDNRSKGYPDFKVRKFDGEEVWIEAELLAFNFDKHGHDPKEVEEIVCVWSSSNKVKNVDVKALEMVESERKKYNEIVRNVERSNLSNAIRADLKQKLDVALVKSDYDQRDILEGLIELGIDESGRVPEIKPEVVESYEDLNEE